MNTDKKCREEFEAKCQFMRVEFSLEWDQAGFYSQLEADRCYTWFKLGFDQATTYPEQHVRASDDSPSGAQMLLTTLYADTADIELLTTFGQGDVAVGLHRAAQLVRGRLLSGATAGPEKN